MVGQCTGYWRRMGKGRRTCHGIQTVTCACGTAKVIVKSYNDHMQRWWCRNLFYERRMLEYIQRRYHGGVWIDAGSSIGNHTLFFAKFCGVDRVESIEPVESSMFHQQEIITLNGLQDKVLFHNVALSDVGGRGSMEKFGDPATWNSGMYKLVSGDDVEVTTLDDIVGSESNVTLVKIDVEYSEYDVLKGATQLLSQIKPVLFVELSSKQAYENVTTYLRRFGYRVGAEKFNKSPTYEFTA